MNGDDIESVIQSVQDWTGPRSDLDLESDTQTALVVSCSTSSCKPPGPLWPVDATWDVVSVQTFGNQIRERYVEKRVETAPSNTSEPNTTSQRSSSWDTRVVGFSKRPTSVELHPIQSHLPGSKSGWIRSVRPSEMGSRRESWRNRCHCRRYSIDSSSTASADRSDFSSRHSPRR
jgi:hypothetical protein